MSAGAQALLPGAMSLGVGIAAEKQPSPLQNKPLLQPKNLAYGAESLQDMNYCRAADTLFPNFSLFAFFLLPLFPLLFERKNTGAQFWHFFFPPVQKKVFFSFSYRYMEQCMISVCCVKKRRGFWFLLPHKFIKMERMILC